jgi:hypothetical protein
MMMRISALVVLGSGCGGVKSPPPATDAAVTDGAMLDQAPGPTATTYKGSIAQTMPAVTFGGPAPKCTYSMTLKQLEVHLAILPSGQVASGAVQALYSEALVANCTGMPADPAIMNYAFVSATPSPTGMTLKLQEEAGDKPGASLIGELATVSAAYQVRLTFHRTDLLPPLDWMVVAPVALTPQ